MDRSKLSKGEEKRGEKKNGGNKKENKTEEEKKTSDQNMGQEEKEKENNVTTPSTHTQEHHHLVTRKAGSFTTSGPTLTWPCSMKVVAVRKSGAILLRSMRQGRRRRQNEEAVTRLQS